MRTVATLIFGIAMFILEQGLNMSGIENDILKYNLWALGGFLLILSIVMFLWPTKRAMKEEQELRTQIGVSDVMVGRDISVGNSAVEVTVKSESGPAIKTGDGSPVSITNSFNRVTQDLPKSSTQPWYRRSGCPQFQMSPGINPPKQLLCQFKIHDAQPYPADVKARWVGPGINMDWFTPMRENVPAGATYRHYGMKGTDMSPKPPHDELIFEVKFYFEDEEHGGRWRWPVHQEAKGHWVIEAAKGSGFEQPLPEDTW